MSGGVDSAVAAHLAAERGDEVVAVTLELWADPAVDTTRSCCSSQAVATARALAHGMGIPHVTLDLREPFGDRVVADFVAEHRAGRTPNPCVRCNGMLRFDAMLDLADRLGAARLATGHYARVEHDRDGAVLALARDTRKDQTYMLAALPTARLDRVWFPLGDLTKPEVRQLARDAALPVADKPESQDLCFLAGAGGREAFLRRHAPDLVADDRGGEIVDADGHVVGRHTGHRHFTVGQRRGLGIAGPEPLYVLDKDAAQRARARGSAPGAARDPGHRARRRSSPPRSRGGPRQAALPLRAARGLRRGAFGAGTPPAPDPRAGRACRGRRSRSDCLSHARRSRRGMGSNRCRPECACRLRPST